MTIPSQSIGSSAVQAKPGWYEDPEGTGKDRWWNGSIWTDVFHKAPRRSMYGPGYARSMRTGLNRSARIGSLTARIGFLLFLVFFLISALLGNQRTHTAAVGLLGFVVLSIVLGVAAIIYGSIGISRSEQTGGLGASIYAICAGSVTVLLSGSVVFIALLSLLHA